MPGRLLVAYSNSSNYVATTAQYLASFGRYSSWDVRYIHVTHRAEVDCDLSEYDAVLQSYCARLPIAGCVVPGWIEALTKFRGFKILAVQDEYDNTNKLREAIRDIGFDAVLTCVPQSQIHRVYPPHLYPATAFLPVLTGYVPEQIAGYAAQAKPLDERDIVVGYRGRDISPRYGRLAFDKIEIGRRMKAVCADRGIPHDIAWNEGDRLYGDAWYSWIGRCRVNLATESGSNAFDWDGLIEEECRKRNPRGPIDWQRFLEWVSPFEVGHDMGQISPRIFEAAAMGTALVLYPGRYSDVLEPDKHYIPLERDFSNIDDVLERIADVPALSAMAERAWQDLIGSHRHDYRGFVESIDHVLDRLARVRGVRLREPIERPDGEPAMVDSAALRSLVERPTRQPHPPLLFSFKHIAEENARLRNALLEQQALARAFSDRVTEQREDYEAEIARYRLQLARGHAAARENGDAVAISG